MTPSSRGCHYSAHVHNAAILPAGACDSPLCMAPAELRRGQPRTLAAHGIRVEVPYPSTLAQESAEGFARAYQKPTRKAAAG